MNTESQAQQPGLSYTGEITGVATLISLLRDVGGGDDEPLFWFRGHENSTYRLVPSGLRTSKARGNERAMVKRFMQDAAGVLVSAPESEWAWLFMAQHHGVPTRLLDWSENALVGLYFASERKRPVLEGEPPPDGDLWVLVPSALNADSGWHGNNSYDVPMFGVDPVLNDYLSTSAPPPEQELKPLAGLAPREFQRVINQWGTFTIAVDERPLEDRPNADSCLHRFRVPADSKDDIRRELSYLGMEEKWVYPDLHRVGERVRGLFT